MQCAFRNVNAFFEVTCPSSEMFKRDRSNESLQILNPILSGMIGYNLMTIWERGDF
jgi:hypothetical protein